MTDAQNEPENDHLRGVAAIAAHLGWTRRQVYHAHEQGYLPTFKIGATICARRSTLAAHFAAQEAAARAATRDA